MAETPPQDTLLREKHALNRLVASRAARLAYMQESQKRADDDAREVQQQWRVEPDHVARGVTHDVPQPRSILTIDHPPAGVLLDRIGDFGAELDDGRFLPIRLPVERVERDVGDVEDPS